jgi:outer membrane protein assembly factor BamB
MRSILTTGLMVLYFTACFSQSGPTGWRGPNRDGIFNEKDLLTTWPSGGPQLLWKYEDLGTGFASAAVTADRVYTVGTHDSISYVFCFDHPGKLLWKKALGKEWTRNFPGSRSTPTLYDGTGYYTNGNGVVYAFSAADGSILWQRDLMIECQGTNRNWGFSDNLIVDTDKIYCTPSGKKQNVVALDRYTGKTIWEGEGNGESSAYCTPILIQRNNRKLFINQPGISYIALDPANGKLIWKYDKKEEHLSSHRTPIYKDGYLLGLDDETTGCVMLRIAPDGSDAEVAWRNPELFSVQGEAVVLGDRIYSPGNRSKLVCADWKTGRTLFSEPFGSGIFVLIAAEDLIYSYDVNGNFKLLKALDDRMQIMGSFRVTGGSNEHFSHPVIRDGRLYIRHENSLFVYNISTKSLKAS